MNARRGSLALSDSPSLPYPVDCASATSRSQPLPHPQVNARRAAHTRGGVRGARGGGAPFRRASDHVHSAGGGANGWYEVSFFL